METVFGILLGVFVLVVLVVIHELGHAIAARRNEVVVEEFGIGFPPKMWARKLKNGVLFSLNWLPLGGFVKLQGEHDAADQKGDYGAASFWQKTKILLAGVLINWVAAAVLFGIMAAVGMPKLIENQFYVPSDTTISASPLTLSSIASDYPAEAAGLEAGDEIVSFAGEEIETADQFIDATASHRGETVPVTYTRDGEIQTVDVALRDSEAGSIFGAGLSQQETLRATWSAPIVGVTTAGQLSWTILEGLGNMIGNLASGLVLQFSPEESARTSGQEQLDTVSQSVAGPIGILGVLFPAAGQAGLGSVVLLSAVISLTLAIMNTLPIPALDGGRWFTMALFRLFRKPLKKDVEEKIQASGFVALMLLVVLVTIGDVAKLF